MTTAVMERTEAAPSAPPQDEKQRLTEALAALDAYKKKMQLSSDSAVARRMDISGAQISNWRKHATGERDYRGNVEAFVNLVWQFLGTKGPTRTGVPLRAGFHPTRMAREVQSLLSRAHAHGELGLILGQPGLGKSRACTEYVRNHPMAMHIEVASAFSPTTIISRICSYLGTTAKGTPREVFASAWEHLKKKGDQWLIVIDQAHRLNKPALASLCELWMLSSTEDEKYAARIGPGLVFIGLDDFYPAFQAKLPEFFDRCSFTRAFMPDEMTATEWKAVIKSAFGQNGVNYDDDALNAMLRQRKTQRSLLSLTYSLVRIAQSTNKPVTGSMVRAAVSMLG